MAKRLKYKRIMLKLSGEVLEGEKGSGIDFSMVEQLCKEVTAVKKMGVEVVIVIGGGNFWRYRDFVESGIDRVHSDYMGMMATIMNSLALRNGFRKFKIDARPLSAFAMPVVVETYLVEKGLAYLGKGKIVICAGGTGNPFFTTDTAAALRALELNCDVLMKATKVDYVYDKDPVKHKDAKKFKKLSYHKVLDMGLEVMDLSAVSLCADNKLPIAVFNLTKKGNIARVVKGQDVGTLIT
ncbi:MAG: UMP kinase [Candidatus Gracilibacteria bacterium]|nr:UMP kinase [Candidatus Peregrinibacteria bacterium]